MKQRLDYASCENLFEKQIPSDHDYYQAEPDQFQNTLTMPKKSVSPRKNEIKKAVWSPRRDQFVFAIPTEAALKSFEHLSCANMCVEYNEPVQCEQWT